MGKFQYQLHHMVVKLYQPCFTLNVCLPHRFIVSFWGIVTFLITAPYKYSYLLTYILTDEFLVNKYLWKNT